MVGLFVTIGIQGLSNYGRSSVNIQRDVGIVVTVENLNLLEKLEVLVPCRKQQAEPCCVLKSIDTL